MANRGVRFSERTPSSKACLGNSVTLSNIEVKLSSPLEIWASTVQLYKLKVVHSWLFIHDFEITELKDSRVLVSLLFLRMRPALFRDVVVVVVVIVSQTSSRTVATSLSIGPGAHPEALGVVSSGVGSSGSVRAFFAMGSVAIDVAMVA